MVEEKSEFLKEKFMKRVLFSNAWNDAIAQHVKFYKDNKIKADRKSRIKDDLKNYIENEIVEKYKAGMISLENYINKILEFHDYVEKKYGDELVFTFGRAQKLINVLLKYYWCANLLNGYEPVHMPFDKKMLEKIGVNRNWTELNNIKEYIEWVDKASDKAKKEALSLSEWELKEWMD